jgi:hypothetical protein
VLYDQHEPLPGWAEPGNPASLNAVRGLTPGRRFDVAAASGDSASLAFSAALNHLTRGLVLFQPSLVPEPGVCMAPGVPVEELAASADWLRPVVTGLQETDPVRRRELVVTAWRDRYGPHLAPDDLALVCEVIGDHTEELFASMESVVKSVAAAAEAGEDTPGSGGIAMGRLGEIDMPITIVVSERAVRYAEAAAGQARDCRVLVAKAQTNFLWLEDPDTAEEAITQMLARIGADQGT